MNANAEVDDIVQDAFVTAWQRLADLEDPGKVKSWLMRIVSHKAIDRIRAARPQVVLREIFGYSYDEIAEKLAIETPRCC